MKICDKTLSIAQVTQPLKKRIEGRKNVQKGLDNSGNTGFEQV
jgi:hypothetical protein